MMPSDPLMDAVFAGQPLSGCRVIDTHGHLGEDLALAYVTQAFEPLVAQMDRMGVEMTAVSSLQALLGDAAGGHRTIAAALHRYPDRFFGYMSPDIGYPERIRPEFERCLTTGFRGIKIFQGGGRPGLPYNHPHYRLVYEFAAEHRLPILAHTWGSELEQLEPALKTYPEINFLFAHTGSMMLPEYIRLGRTYPNAFLELCFSACPRNLVENLVAVGLEDKVVWGSDVIFMDSTQQIGRVIFAKIPYETKLKIIGLNAIHALRLG